jgi:hypothetical protein
LRIALKDACRLSIADILKNIQKNWLTVGKIYRGNQIEFRPRWSELNCFRKVH